MLKIENLLYHLKEYAGLRMQLTELKLSNKGSMLASSLITITILCMLAFFFVLVLTIGISLWIGSYLGEWYLGFLLMAAFYLVVGTVLYFFRSFYLNFMTY